jgi:hypothetical protein
MRKGVRDVSQRNTKALERALASYDPEEPVCPPDCKIDHDSKWYGVTVPVPKKEKQQEVKLPKLEAICYRGAKAVTRKMLQAHQNIYGDSPELHEVARLYGVDLRVRKEKTA